jgi:hypothetical protein
VIRGTFKLTRDEVLSVNSKLLLELESDGVPLVKRTFFIQSKSGAVTGPSKIDFTADQAAADDDADLESVATKRH